MIAVCASSGGSVGRPRGFFGAALPICAPQVLAQRERFAGPQALVALRAGVGRAARPVAMLAVRRVWGFRPAARHVPQVRLAVAAWRAGPRLRSAALADRPHFSIPRLYIIDRFAGVHRLLPLPLSLIVHLVWHNN